MILHITHTDYFEPLNMVVVQPTEVATLVKDDKLFDDAGREYRFVGFEHYRGIDPSQPSAMGITPQYRYSGEIISTISKA